MARALTRPIHGVVGRYVVQTRCPSDVGIATVDFDPPGAGQVGLVLRADAQAQLPVGYVEALWVGIRDGLTEVDGSPLVAAIVTLRDARHHEVDSRPFSFEQAGRLIADEVRARLAGPGE